MAKDYLELTELLARIKEGVEDAFPDRCGPTGTAT